MSYKLVPVNNNVTLIPLKPQEVKQYTSKVLTDVETSRLDVLNYGRVVELFDPTKAIYETGDIVLYQKLAAHKTNFGDPRQVVVPFESIEAKLEEIEQ